MKKETQYKIVVLSAEKSNIISNLLFAGRLFLNDKEVLRCGNIQPEHLYILGLNENLKINDKILYKNTHIYTVLEFDAVGVICENDFKATFNEINKIVATTNYSLNIPLIDEEFVKEYVNLQGELKINNIEYYVNENKYFVGYLTSEEQISMKWWNNLSLERKNMYGFMYFEEIKNSNRTLDTLSAYDINVIYNEKNNSDKEIINYIFDKPNQKQFKKFDETLFKSYVEKFQTEDLYQMISILKEITEKTW